MEIEKGLAYIQATLRKNGIEPKRAFGQNFLVDSDAINTIVSSFDVESYDTVIEIGPGLGALTFPLVKRAKRFIAIEADRDMVKALTPELAKYPNAALLNVPFEKWVNEEDLGKLLVIGNLPYNLTSKLIGCASKLNAMDLGFMVQKEVGDKLQYQVGNKDCQALSCYLALLGEVKQVCYVPRGCFYPIPKVDSCFVSLHIERSVPFEAYQGLKLLFMTPNKKLGNVIKESISDVSALASIQEKYASLLTLRARQVEPKDLMPLALAVYNAHKS